MMEKKGAGKVLALLEEVFLTWKDDAAHEKDLRDNAANVAALQGKLTGLQKSQAEASKKMLSRMNGNNSTALMGLAWQAWQSFHADYAKDKELEDQVKAAEARIAEMLKAKGDGAKKVMSSMGGGSDLGIMKIHLDAWKTLWEDAKKENELAEALQKAQAKRDGFCARGKKGAKSVMERAKQHMDAMLLLKLLNCWKMETSVEATLRKYHLKVDAKRSQLVQVQQMFRGFSSQLERGLREGESARDHGTNRSKRSLGKSEGTVSLPDIHGEPRKAWA